MVQSHLSLDMNMIDIVLKYIYKFLSYLIINHHNIFSYYKSIVFVEFIISLLIIFVLFLTLLQRNYTSIYSLLFLNCIIFILYLTVTFQEVFIYGFFNMNGYVTPDWKNPIFGNKITLLMDFLETGISFEILKKTGHWFGSFATPYYKGNAVFSLFNYYVKLFSLGMFILCLLVGYLHRKNLKISFDKILLVLLPLLFSTLVIIQTQDIIIGFLSIELQNLCLIFLMSLKKNNHFNIQLSVRFFILNSVGSLFILFGIVLLYSVFHTTNMANIYSLFISTPEYFYSENLEMTILLAFGILLIGLMFKLGVGPFGLWLVDIYEYSLSYGILVFSVLPKISYFMYIFHLYLMSSQLTYFWDFVLKFFGVISIILGTFGALEQVYLKRLLAFSSLNYFGYILLSFVGFNAKSTVLCIMYLYVYMFVSFFIWFVILYLEKVTKRNIVLTDLVIFRDHYPVLAYMLACCFLFLAGLPPFYLFFLKFGTFFVLLNSLTGWYIIIGFLYCNFISIYYYLTLVKILLFNPLPSRNYPCLQFNTITIYLIIIFGFYCLTPFIFILLKKVYVLLNKVLKNYYSTIFSNKTRKILHSKLNILRTTKKLLNTQIYKTRLYDKLVFGITKINAINIRNHPLKLLNNLKIAFKSINEANNPKKLIVKYSKKLDDFICDFGVNFNVNIKKYDRAINFAFYKFCLKLNNASSRLNYIFLKKEKFIDYFINKTLSINTEKFSKHISKKFISRLKKSQGVARNYYIRAFYKRLIKYYYIISGYNLKLNKNDQVYNNHLNRYIRLKFKRSLLIFRKITKPTRANQLFWLLRFPRFTLKYHMMLKTIIQSKIYIINTHLVSLKYLTTVLAVNFSKLINYLKKYFKGNK